MNKNQLYYGDNLTVLREYIKDESVDLIYLDPPFNSRQDYNVLFAEKSGERSASQIMAFEDTWEWNMDAERAYEEIVERGGRVSDAMRAFRTFLGHSDMMAYLAMMAPRLIELHRVLKETGSIYLHCDPTASHYLKILMDGVFGPAGGPGFQSPTQLLLWVPRPSRSLRRAGTTTAETIGSSFPYKRNLSRTLVDARRSGLTGQVESLALAASYPPLQKTQGRGTHSLGTGSGNNIESPGHPPKHRTKQQSPRSTKGFLFEGSVKRKALYWPT